MARIGVRGSVAVRRLANPVTLCGGHGAFFVAASGQIRKAADKILHAGRRGVACLPRSWRVGGGIGNPVLCALTSR